MAQALGEVKAEPVQIPSNLIEAEFMVFSSRGQFPKTEATKSVLLFFSISCLNVQQSGVMDGKLELGVILMVSKSIERYHRPYSFKPWTRILLKIAEVSE